MKIYKNYINSKILQKIHHRGQKKTFCYRAFTHFYYTKFCKSFYKFTKKDKV